MELKGEDYLVTYNELKNAIEFFGTIRLRDSSDYASIDDMLIGAHRKSSGSMMILDFRNLQFLNSAGINVISKFVITARRAGSVTLKVLGNSAITWQQKSLKNLQKLWSLVQIEIT
jgi:hypothetical protein